MNMNESKTTRRAFLYKMASSSLLIVGGVLWTACQSGKNTKNKTADAEDSTDGFGGDCGDYSKLTANDLNARKQLGYEEKSPVAEQECRNCNLWLPPKEGQTCGGCTLFKGPIEPKGTCTYWAPRQS